MVALRCPCGGEHEIWGELWWVGGTREWVYFEIWKRAKPTLSRLRTALGVVGSSSAETSRRSVSDRTGRRLSRATAKSQHWIKVCCHTLSV